MFQVFGYHPEIYHKSDKVFTQQLPCVWQKSPFLRGPVISIFPKKKLYLRVISYIKYFLGHAVQLWFTVARMLDNLFFLCERKPVFPHSRGPLLVKIPRCPKAALQSFKSWPRRGSCAQPPLGPLETRPGRFLSFLSSVKKQRHGGFQPGHFCSSSDFQDRDLC